jgi:hypothetical protein
MIEDGVGREMPRHGIKADIASVFILNARAPSTSQSLCALAVLAKF